MTEIVTPFSQEQFVEAGRRAKRIAGGTDAELSATLGLSEHLYASILGGLLEAISEEYEIPITTDLKYAVRDTLLTGLLYGRFLYGEDLNDG